MSDKNEILSETESEDRKDDNIEKVIANVIDKEKIERYLKLTQEALKKARKAAPPRSYASEIADNFYSMANTYYSDALFFYSSGNWVNAFAAVNYAHGWLDAGARLGLFDVGEDDRLFTLLK
ncbi:MAG: DUF357 domain-containing protein [Thermoplasmata archaeon]